MGGKRRELLERAEELIKSYNPKRTTLESHATEFLAGNKTEADAAFLKELLYGVMRCKAALKVFMACFFNDMSARVLRSDYTMYMILAYLSVFRLKELTIPEYRKFVLSIDPDKMVNFLEYVFCASTLEKSGVVAYWTKVFDPDYVRDTLLGDLTCALPEVQGIIHELQDKSMGLAAAKQASEERRGNNGLASGLRTSPTVPNAPNLTKPAPRRVPEPRTIEQMVIRTSMPTAHAAGRDSSSRNLLNPLVEAKSQSRLRRSKTTTCEAIDLHETRSTLEQAQATVEKRTAKELDFSKFKGGTGMRKHEAIVKINTATILREDALFRAKQEQEAAKINAYEAELRDSSDFHRWQTEMRAQDQKTRLEQIARTRVLAKASAEEAHQAKLNQLLDNRQLAARGVEEGRAMQKQRQLETEMTLFKKKHLVGEVKEERETAPKLAVESVLERKNQIRKGVQHDMETRLKHRQDENDARAKALAEHVKRLKAEQSVHRDHTNFFDPTDTVGLGLLDEMSLVEMQERLTRNRKRDQENCEQKRKELVVARNAKRDRLAERVKNIKKVREAAAEKNHKTSQYQSQCAADLKTAIQHREERLLLDLVEELEIKRTVLSSYREKLRDEAERTKKDQLFAGAGEQLKEKKAHEELLKGAERMAKNTQRRSLERTAMYETTKSRELHQNTHNRILKEASHRKTQTRKEGLVKEAAHEMMCIQKEEIAEKKKKYFNQKKAHRERMETIVDPYTERINELSVTRARRHAAHRQEVALGIQ